MSRRNTPNNDSIQNRCGYEDYKSLPEIGALRVDLGNDGFVPLGLVSDEGSDDDMGFGLFD